MLLLLSQASLPNGGRPEPPPHPLATPLFLLFDYVTSTAARSSWTLSHWTPQKPPPPPATTPPPPPAITCLCVSSKRTKRADTPPPPPAATPLPLLHPPPGAVRRSLLVARVNSLSLSIYIYIYTYIYIYIYTYVYYRALHPRSALTRAGPPDRLPPAFQASVGSDGSAPVKRVLGPTSA